MSCSFVILTISIQWCHLNGQRKRAFTSLFPPESGGSRVFVHHIPSLHKNSSLCFLGWAIAHAPVPFSLLRGRRWTGWNTIGSVRTGPCSPRTGRARQGRETLGQVYVSMAARSKPVRHSHPPSASCLLAGVRCPALRGALMNTDRRRLCLPVRGD